MARKLDIVVQITVTSDRTCARSCRYFNPTLEACALHPAFEAYARPHAAMRLVPLKRKGRGFLRSDACRAAELDLLGMKAM